MRNRNRHSTGIRLLILRCGLAWAAISGLSGCGDELDPAELSAQTQNFYSSVAQASCEWDYRCCSDDIIEASGAVYTDVASCVPYRALQIERETYAYDLFHRQGRFKLMASRVDGCLEAIAASPCYDRNGLGGMRSNAVIRACGAVFVGAVAAGEECHMDIGECEPHTRCVDVSAATAVCVPYQQENEICNATADCERSSDVELYCSTDDKRCHRPGKLGEVCGPVEEWGVSACDRPTFCDLGTNTCKALPKDGEPCALVRNAPSCDPTQPLRCVSELSPDGQMATSICRRPAALGEPCGEVGCVAGLWCDGSQGARVCAALPTLGQLCNYSETCANDLACIYRPSGSTCEVPQPLGARCAAASDCASLYCFFGAEGATCQPGGVTSCTGRE